MSLLFANKQGRRRVPRLPGLPSRDGQAYGRLRGSDDFREGIEAFHAKRKPNFRGS